MKLWKVSFLWRQCRKAAIPCAVLLVLCWAYTSIPDATPHTSMGLQADRHAFHGRPGEIHWHIGNNRATQWDKGSNQDKDWYNGSNRNELWEKGNSASELGSDDTQRDRGNSSLDTKWDNESNRKLGAADLMLDLGEESHVWSSEVIREDYDRMEKRRNIVRNFCSKRGVKSQNNFLGNKNMVISENSKFLHCPVGKAASTFWSRFVLSLTPSGKMASPFDFPLEPPGRTPDRNFQSLGNASRKRRFHSEATRNMFVRDPYHRFFSGYVDKVFAPNPTYWKRWGVPAIQVYRNGADPKSLSCGHDVTFAEMMSYIARKLYRTDSHFQSAFIVCQPCGVKYDIIGKMETFSEDLRYISHRMNLSLTDYFSSRRFRNEFAKDAIEDTILSPFAWARDISRCMTKHEAGLRIWRKLQIRGIVSRRMPFPYSSVQFEKVTAHQFIRAAISANRKSTDKEELNRQKRDAFLEAYSTVSDRDLVILKKNYKQEFEVFDYKPDPYEVFHAKDASFTRGAFDWTKEWGG